MPVNLQWTIVAAVEMVTFAFFIIVGYKFRPANSHNYLLLNSDFDSYDVETSPKEDRKDKENNEQEIDEQWVIRFIIFVKKSKPWVEKILQIPDKSLLRCQCVEEIGFRWIIKQPNRLSPSETFEETVSGFQY